MRRFRPKGLAIMGAIGLCGGVLFQTPGCATFGLQSALAALDFCAILDCQNGLFGGLIRPCGSPLSVEDDILADCQNFVTANP